MRIKGFSWDILNSVAAFPLSYFKKQFHLEFLQLKRIYKNESQIYFEN